MVSWKTIQKKGFECRYASDRNTEPYYYLLSPIITFRGSRGLQSDSLTSPTRASPLVKISILFAMLSTGHLESLLTSKNSTQRGSHSLGTHKTCPKYLNLFSCSACSKDWILGSSILRLTPEWLTKIFPHILPTQRRQRCRNNKSLRISSAPNACFGAVEQYRRSCRYVYSSADR